MQITNTTKVQEILDTYPWLIEKANDFGEEIVQIVNNKVLRLILSKKTIHEICKQFNLDEEQVIIKINTLLNKWIAERNGNYLFKDIEKNKISTPKLNWIIDKLLGSDCDQAERSILRVAILTTSNNMADLTIKKVIQNIKDLDNYLTEINNIEFNNDKESFMPFTEYKFVANLSNGTEVELCENGNNKTLSLETKKEFIELLLKTRLNEGNVQIQSIRNGLEQVIPFGLLKLLSWNELEMLVCGKPILDIELLKENTQYNGCNINDQLIQNFWKCLEEFSAEERASYLRFVWGRSRLPLTSKDFPMQHRISIKSHNNPDLALPMSHTCFFSIDLPRYSSYEVLKSKLKYAITHCQAIDTDMVTREIWDDEE